VPQTIYGESIARPIILENGVELSLWISNRQASAILSYLELPSEDIFGLFIDPKNLIAKYNKNKSSEEFQFLDRDIQHLLYRFLCLANAAIRYRTQILCS
jgi:hypothetical protein